MSQEMIVNKAKLITNINAIKKMMDSRRIEVAAVTKVFCGNPDISKLYVDCGISILADSRLENLLKIKHYPVRKMHLRLPMLSEASEVVEYSDVSLVSHKETAKQLSMSAERQKCSHGIILMIDLGDLREGIFEESTIIDTARYILSLPNIQLEGIGTNLTCFGGVLPSLENMNKLYSIKKQLEHQLDVTLNTVSAGNSSSLKFVQECDSLHIVSQLRIGEAFILGRETAYGQAISGTYNDCFTLRAEIIEKFNKPSIPIGIIGTDGFGRRPTFPDNGYRIRAICAIGRQDVDLQQITPVDERVKIIGGSSDHLILDIGDCAHDYHLGAQVTFTLSYSGILQAMTSEYTKTVLV